jgi:hypothetical protein
VCAFLRGEAEVLVVVTVRPGSAGDAALELPAQAAGRWREILGENDIELSGRASLERLGAGWRGMWLAQRG